jgi:hypothetical protein
VVQTLGIAIDPGGGKPKLLGIILSGTSDAPVVEQEFELKAGGDDPGEQAVDLARRLLAKLSGLDYQAAAIRVAGTPPVGSRRKRQFSRAHAEGAALFVIREHLKCPIVTGDPKAFAAMLGEQKDDLVERAKALSKGKADAVMAAIAAFC